ncbi:MAG: prepilin-type N-terminal cleavage/methylation domain-containing protein [Gemmatimonadota bacterium]
MSENSNCRPSLTDPVRADLRKPAGMTLIELLVVLVLLGLGGALILPAILPSRPSEFPVAELLDDTRRVAMRRGEIVRLTVRPDGGWTIGSMNSLHAEPIATGRLAEPVGSSFTILISPLGTCGLDAVSSAAVSLPVDPLTCEVRTR